MLCSTDLFIDWGSSSNNLSGYISKFGETQLPVVSRTSLVNLVTGVFMFYKTLDASMNIYKDYTPDHK